MQLLFECLVVYSTGPVVYTSLLRVSLCPASRSPEDDAVDDAMTSEECTSTERLPGELPGGRLVDPEQVGSGWKELWVGSSG